MILADKITEERKRNGWSQEELAEKLGVSRQAVSKWESAGSVPDLQRVIQLAELFGVSTDYLLKDEMEQAEVVVYSNTESEEAGHMRRVSMEEANEFLEMKRKDAPTIANAVSMCILSPTLLVLLGILAEEPRFHVSEAFAGGIGCIFLFGMIAAAVFMLITCGIREKRTLRQNMEFLEWSRKEAGLMSLFLRGELLLVLCSASFLLFRLSLPESWMHRIIFWVFLLYFCCV